MPTCGYHFTGKAVSFGKGQSAVHTAAYNARQRLHEERCGRTTKDYGERYGPTLFSGIFAPKGAPAWVQDREQLWNRAEAAERQKNGQPARNLEFSFPHQLNQQQREWLLKDFVREEFVRKGMIADANIHAPHPQGDDRNFHAHVLLTMRELDGENFATKKNRDWNRIEHMEHWRARWAEMGGRALERAGYQVEADRWRQGHKTLPEQREAAIKRGDLDYAEEINREATKHRGPAVDAIERKDIETERGEAARAIEDQNATLAGLKAELETVNKLIVAAEREQRQQEMHDRFKAELEATTKNRAEARILDADQNARFDDRTREGDVQPNAKAFAEALEQKGIAFAVVTPEESYRSHREQAFARAAGRTSQFFQPGEIVAVTEPGLLYHRNGEWNALPRVHKLDQTQAAQYLKFLSLDTSQLKGIDATKAMLDNRAQTRAAHSQDIRLDNATWMKDWAPERSPKDRSFPALQRGALAKGGKIADYVANIIGEAIEMLGNMFGATAMTPERIQAAVDARDRAAKQQDIDLARFRIDADYRRQVQAREREKLEKEAQKYSERERERDR